MSYRPDKVAHQLKAEISDIISRELHDPRVGFVTITNIKVSQDLSHARIYVSVFGSAQQQRDSINALNRAAGYIRREIGTRMRLRKSPELVFTFDESIEQSVRMAQLIDEANSETTDQSSSDSVTDSQSSDQTTEGDERQTDK
ncbi:MAG TPA: 30S ribosome-binding factor RbfA [Blastocatellia bacterium]|nr:30S ribosome-binding factor RbfA [Blastocatellia bacterium]